MTAASPDLLALQLNEHRAVLSGAEADLRSLIVNLTVGDPYAIDHAEEQIAWVVDALRGAALSLAHLQRYTATGARRVQTGRPMTDAKVAALPKED